MFNVPSNIAIGQYFLENKGEKTCRSGNEITNNKLCEKACKILSIPVKFEEVNKGTVADPCFKHTSGECKKNGNNGGKAFLVCKQGKIMENIYVLNMSSFNQLNIISSLVLSRAQFLIDTSAVITPTTGTPVTPTAHGNKHVYTNKLTTQQNIITIKI